MSKIKNDCENIQKHIKKTKGYLNMFMYVNDGTMFLLMQPFVYLHKKHFNAVKEQAEIIKKYVEENDLKIEIENFDEFVNSATIYSQEQMATLTIKQYEHRIKYLEILDSKIEKLKMVI